MKKINFILGLTGTIFLLANSAWAFTGTAILKGTATDSKITGNVTLTEEKGGLTVVAKVYNVPAGSHGFHVHAIGNCGDMGKAAGGHFNPDKSPHGLYPINDGKYAVKGLSIILHEKKDDFSQPAGNAGGRIACGIIETDSK